MTEKSLSIRAGVSMWLLVLTLSTTLVASGCGGGSTTEPDRGAVQPVAPLIRIQDSRTFSPPVEDSLAPLDDSFANTDRWVGILDGAAYRIEVPQQWNGVLVMWVRGYWNGYSLYIENPLIRRHLLAKGYAWAASSYTRNLYDVNAGIEDTNKLAAAFRNIATARGRPLPAPRRIFIAGMSMGGHIASAAVESEVVRDALNPLRYDGALSLCGTVADIDWYNYLAAYQMAMQQVLGYSAEAYPSQTYAQNKPAMQSLLADAVARRDLSMPSVARLYAVMEQLSGGKRPFYFDGWMDPYHHNILFQLMNGAPTLDGILALKAVDTRNVQYRFSNETILNAETQRFNDTIARIAPDSIANPLQSRGLRWVPFVAGQLTAPVMVLHTIGDLTVPISTQIRYKQRTTGQGNGAKLTQRLIRDVGHCSFTLAEVTTAFDDLVTWAEQGQKPQGDELLDARLWDRVDVGCAHTNSTPSVGDRADLPRRTRIQATYPACPAR